MKLSRILGVIAASTMLLFMFGCEKSEETIKIGYIDPLSGPFANVGAHGLRELELVVEQINERGGVLDGTRFEIVPLDGKANPQESLIAFRQLVDQNVKFMFQGNSSAVAGALTDAVEKHNGRNPESAMIYLNYGAVDPVLTNDRCNFWHFRFDADADMKMQALTNMMAAEPSIKKIYLINQDYSFGHAVAKAARNMLKAKRPDIEIVGDDLHPLGKIKDFAPYISKIKASGADSVITGNWGADLALLVRAGRDSGLDVDYYSYYAGIVGGPAAIGDAGIDHVKQVTMWHVNAGGAASDNLVEQYRARFPDANDDFFFLTLQHGMELLVQAIEKTGSTDPLAIAKAMEGARYEGITGEVWVREDNHQLMQPLYVSTLRKLGEEGVKYDVERTGMGPKTDFRVEAADTYLPTTCEMTRP
ncbi:MAG TPA: branched-chain amino acid ABC transporter substrate-binding protein [Burkholderiales bacterium]|nr:branched-chain amino acid ABC transporter substrate-binding protein [Burkholderiales bacterium]